MGVGLGRISGIRIVASSLAISFVSHWMANMTKRRKAPATKVKPTQDQMDAIVVEQADDERAWRDP